MIEKFIENRLEKVEQLPDEAMNFWDKLEAGLQPQELRSPLADCRSFWDDLEKNIKPEDVRSPLTDCRDFWDNLEKRQMTLENRRVPEKDGHWEGEKGDSKWVPDAKAVPGDRHGTNPKGKTWGEILDEHDIDGVDFYDGEPDFSEVAEAEVEIDDFTDDRAANFEQADEALAEKWDCAPEDVAKWRKENKYTWHEKSDCKTMQLVPTEVHGNVPHSGGVSEYKNKQKA